MAKKLPPGGQDLAPAANGCVRRVKRSIEFVGFAESFRLCFSQFHDSTARHQCPFWVLDPFYAKPDWRTAHPPLLQTSTSQKAHLRLFICGPSERSEIKRRRDANELPESI